MLIASLLSLVGVGVGVAVAVAVVVVVVVFFSNFSAHCHTGFLEECVLVK